MHLSVILKEADTDRAAQRYEARNRKNYVIVKCFVIIKLNVYVLIQDKTVKKCVMHQAAIAIMRVRKTPPAAVDVQRSASKRCCLSSQNIDAKAANVCSCSHMPVCPEHSVSQIMCYNCL